MLFYVLDQPSEDAAANIVAPEGVNVAIGRNIFGQTTAIYPQAAAARAATRSYVYDAFQQLCKTIEPETGSTVQIYDAAKQCVVACDRTEPSRSQLRRPERAS